MLVNSLSTQIDLQEGAANARRGASARNNSTVIEDTVTLSPAAQALQAEQKLAATAAQDALSPSAQALQTQQKIAATAAMLWRSALSLTTSESLQ
ncbi:MAG TPA: hypothetical protein VG322_15690 [Candidatus Acidoferrales bacterium]|jgi:hypothetical protein|nr:hypothetical protein [Candidatus Acidoferrales bacterium]